MFMGEFHHTIDSKGRLIIPAKFRQQLGADFVLTRGMDGCLFGYPRTQWQLLEDKLQQLPLTQRSARLFIRFFYAAAVECQFDKQGRVNLTAALVDYAQLTDQCVVAGVGTRIEIWNTTKWSQMNQEIAVNFEQISEELQDLGDFNL
ncbi:division/cell wall cluster transcriptional repressor MraZ [Lactobacillus sp. DCY120]|uniref:Transcriptional regulator MraZ n=1 Tax=Bombilactobacillus apium TaxID=2675299 RepID=A0A850R000_9LACO|nr:division/cell wall cluster transcriptional repressor MraZ [Bombilactobacillus apium]NVY95670.1 division/cell wall cluster transcriptional repressor MraZ [Bombilactobacillus apium]